MFPPVLLAQADSLSEALQAWKQAPGESLLLPLLVQLLVIVLTARVAAVLFRKLGQPSVIGEIVAGLILGPSVLGRLCPDLAQALFHPTPPHGLSPALFETVQGFTLSSLSQLGLIFLLFLIGLEFDPSHLRTRGKSALAISLSGIALPFLLGFALAYPLHAVIEAHPDLPGQSVPQLGFALFLGTALSITAIPVLARILLELNLQRTRLGTIVVTSAAIDDACGWILLAGVTALVRGNFEWLAMGRMLAETLAFAALLLFVLRSWLRRWARRAIEKGQGELRLSDLTLTIVLLLATAIATNWIGVFAIFGAFLLGATLSEEAAFREAVVRRLRDLVMVFFLPIYFTYTGLRTDVGTLESGTLWLFCGLVLLAAVVGKLGGCGLVAWRTGFTRREAGCIGTLMNTRGLMELIVVNIGYDLRVIPRSVYCMLVIMAVVTTVMTTPILLRLLRGTEWEEVVREAGFLKRKTTAKQKA